jgi:hypothetical protein
MITHTLSFLSLFILSGLTPLAHSANEILCSDKVSINTALGCLNPDIAAKDGLIKQVLLIGVGIGGAMSLLLMLYGAFLITTSAGAPDQIKSGQEIITSAITGLLFIIFSVVILNIIGVNLLQLPGFS